MLDTSNSKSLKQRISTSVSLLMAVTMVVVTLATATLTRNTVVSEVTQSLDYVARSELGLLRQRLEYLMDATRNLATNPLVINGMVDPHGRTEYLPKLIDNFNRNRDVDSLALVDFSGKAVYSNLAEAPSYNGSVALRTALSFASSTAYVDEKRNRLVMISPLIYYETTQGALVAEYDLDAVIRRVFGEGGELIHQVEHDGRKLYGHGMEGDKEYITAAVTLNEFGVAPELQGLGLAVRVGAEREAYLAPANLLALQIAIVGAMITLLTFIIARWFGGTIADPILLLCKRVEQSGMGKWCAPLGTGDELEELARRFDTRTEELLRTQFELEMRVDERTANLKQAQEIAHLGNWEWDVRNNALNWSDEVYRIFGWKPNTFEPDYARFLSAVHPEDRDAVERAVAEALKPEVGEYRITHRILKEDGEVRYVEESGRAEFSEQGEAEHVHGVVQDISERVKAQEELQLFRLMIENSTDPFFLIDNDEGCRLAYVNEAAVRHYGSPREELLTWTIPDWDPNFTPADLPRHIEELKRSAKLGEGLTIETLHRVRGGDLVPVEVSLNLTMYKGHLCHFGYIKNITERKETERRLLDAKEQAEAAAAMKSEFLANMSHEIRTPMNAVINLSRLALNTDLNPRQHDYIQKVLRSGENLLGIINDILDFSKIEAGMLEVENIPFSLPTLISDVSDVIGHRSSGEQVELLMDVPAMLKHKLLGDPLRIRQVLINLLNNALKFTEKGEVALVIDAAETPQGMTRLDFFVCDTGIGMSKEQLGGLFQAFQQADGSITRRYGGTGLGLAISKRLVELMGGEIHVQSQPGLGTTFSFALELKPAGAEEQCLTSLENLRVLVVDDNASAREIIQETMQRFGASVTTCASGVEAVKELQRGCALSRPYQLMLLDWRMPGIDGIETWRRIREDETITTKPRPVMISAFSREIGDEAGKVGIYEILEKPVTPSTLFDVVSECGGREAARAQQSEARVSGIDEITGSKILLVEDNAINQQIAQELLGNIGLEVVTADNGEEALTILNEGAQFDLVFMDLQMPIMDGYAATRAIRSDSRWAKLPIIAMTAHALTEERERCLAAGMNDHLAKPIDVEVLYRVLTRWIKPRNDDRTVVNHPPGVVVDESGMPESLPGFDLQRGLKLLGGNTKLYLKLLGTLEVNHANDCNQLNSALEAQEYETAATIAHTLKGVAGNLGAVPLTQSAAQLEQAAGTTSR